MFRWMSVAVVLCSPLLVLADGMLRPPRNYVGSLEEQAQEAIIIFHESDRPGEAVEDLILKIRVTAKGEALSQFAWIVPFPTAPETFKEDSKLFEELFRYVDSRSRTEYKGEAKAASAPKAEAGVDVVSRKIVGSFDVAVVRENEAGALKVWLNKEGFRALEGGDEVVEFYREKEYVFACMKVSDAALVSGTPADLHPLRFTFKTGGRDGVFFPMKLSGLQRDPFDVNLYVFHRYWLNDKLSQYGYEHRGFTRRYRDWDTKACVPNGGKAWSNPEADPLLKSHANTIPTVKKLFQKLYPGDTFYLTNIQANHLQPEEVAVWKDDLWLFPYYTNRNFVPFDARPDGPARSTWPNVRVSAEGLASE